MKQCQYFGPYPLSYLDMVNLDTAKLIIHIMNTVAGVTSEKDVRKPFLLMREKEISKEDRAFLGKMMLMDPRDRPTATELLKDEWFADPGDDLPSGNR